ncbi:synaptonemal complex central element protein 2 [Hyperolius riggenbachi]|uniref:synaptonemal complex central element protein 2 n=1 Tax=Hyperolius riggenbachi TaxID=752182 RepID=UPI0035A2F616
MADLEVINLQEEPENTCNAKPGPSSAPASARSSSPPGSGGDALNITASKPCGNSPSYFAALDATVEALQDRAQSLIDKINEKRAKDQIVMKNFKANLNMKVAEMTQILEDRMYQQYEKNNNVLQAKLKELTEVIEDISHLQESLKQVCHTITTVYNDLGLQPDM